MSKESLYIILIIKKIEDILQWRPVSEWAEYDYKKLSDLIFQKTNTLISPLTIKRIFRNTPGTYNPKLGTKNALALFAGYADWQAFTEKERPRAESMPEVAEPLPSEIINEEEITGERKKDSKLVLILITATLIIAGGMTGYLFWKNSDRSSKESLPEVTLYSDITYGDLPFTTSIHYDISEIEGEEVYLEYAYNNKNISKRLDKNKHEINLSFELPGAYTLSLKTKDKTLKMTYVTAQSNGWYGYYFNHKGHFGAYKKEYTSPLDTFIYDTIHDGNLYFSPCVMKEFGADIRHPYFVNNTINNDFKVNGRNCSLEVRFCNALKEGGMGCQACHFMMLGDTGWINVYLTNPKSYSYAGISLAGKSISGETENLKSLGVKMNEWGVFKIINKDSLLLLVYNNDTIYRTVHHSAIGNIRQLTLTSQGSAKYDYIRLYNQNDSLAYSDDFN